LLHRDLAVEHGVPCPPDGALPVRPFSKTTRDNIPVAIEASVVA
jgi:hypothetical protein